MRIVLLLGAALIASAGSPATMAQAPQRSVSGSAPQPAPPPQSPIDRARANYEAILAGRITLFNLSPAEQDEVRELDRRIRATQPPDRRDAQERCLDSEYARLGREPSALDQRTIETRCR